ncbi:hypothetical protein TNCV_3032131 [Trichonephila clavipes]|nr:hypothetical protein TNCV_3032131 [Trichonephila clavipes]
MAKIIELIPGRDGKIRPVKLKTQHGTVLRPVQHVYPLEIRANENCVTEEVAGPLTPSEGHHYLLTIIYRSPEGQKQSLFQTGMQKPFAAQFLTLGSLVLVAHL